jgi:hypothetical protein
MRRKIFVLILASFFILVVWTTGLSFVAAKPALSPLLQVTVTQSATVTITTVATLEPVISIAAVESALSPPLQVTATPSTTVTVTATVTPEPVLSTVGPVATQEIDPEALILEDGWQFPINLSRSGETSGPQLVIDSRGTGHILWSDEVEGFGYTVGSGEEWSKLEASEFPFFTRRYFPDLRDEAPTPLFRPVLTADERGQIYAFWVGDKGVLYYSSVPSTSFTDYDSWTPRAALTDNALIVASTMDPDGRLHLVYLRPEKSDTRPAGVYYRQLSSSGTWNDPTLLYASLYLRSVPANVANIQVFAPDSSNVYVVWDDTLREQIYFAGSNSNGLSWDTPQEIDRRASEDAETAVGPTNIIVGTNNEQLQLTWSAGHEPGRECSQYVSTSSDGGTTWTYRETLASLPLCFATAQFLVADETLFLLGTTKEEGSKSGSIISTSYLLAWDGSRWSEPQIQEALSGFSNPETNQTVRLQCHSVLGQGSMITLIGCDSGGGSDIWLLGREVGEIEEWFPPPPVWQGPDEVNGGGSQPAETRLVRSGDGSIHAFWNEKNSSRIYHASWDGESWSFGQQIITSPGGNVTMLAATSGGDRLFLTWEDPVRGLQFSTASISSPSEWVNPASLVDELTAASAPSIIADAGGNVFLAFAVQLNEARGVYLIHSADAGDTWSTPIQIFDGPAAGWDMVDKPLLTRTDNGQMHLMWTRRSLPPDSIPLGLAYSRSEDLGQTWSEAETVVETQSYWSELIGAGERFVHGLWSEESSNRQGIWHRYSLDGGLTWSQSEQVSGLNNSGALSVAADPAQRPHLLNLENGQLRDLIWDDGQWTEDDGLGTTLGEGGFLDGITNQRGQLIVAYTGHLAAEKPAETDSRLFAMWRMLDLPVELPAQLPTLTPTRPVLTPTPTMTPQPTATVFFSTQQEQSGLGEISGLAGLPISLDLIASLIPVLLIVGLGMLIGIRIIRKR